MAWKPRRPPVILSSLSGRRRVVREDVDIPDCDDPDAPTATNKDWSMWSAAPYDPNTVQIIGGGGGSAVSYNGFPDGRTGRVTQKVEEIIVAPSAPADPPKPTWPPVRELDLD